ncbi:hypothetical protein FS837_000394 [Tulasnella sp. UAMH 9824]|nr:hypothetical protein FS837_000394 [Tulasnella sp. UAMH 9824]
MVDRNSPSPVAASPSTRSAIKSPLSAAKDALAKTHTIHPTSEPTPITVDLPESTFQLEAPNGHTDSIPPIEGEAEEAESQSKETHSLEEAEGRVNGTVNGTDSNNDSPTGDDPIQSDAASPKPPDSPTDPKPTERASDDLELEPASTALASPPVASRQSSPSRPEEVPPSDQDTRPSDSITSPPPTAEAPSAQALTEENLETATDEAVTTHPANSDSAELDNKASEGVADSRESAASGSSADINAAATALQTEVDLVPESEEQSVSGAVATTTAPSGVVDPPLEPTGPSSPDPPAAADDSSDAKQTADEDKGDDDMDTSFTHGVDSLQPPQFFPDSDMGMMADASSLLPHQPGLGFDNVEELSQATGPADPSTEDVSSMQDFMNAPSNISEDMALSVTDFINDPPDPPQMDVDPTSSIPFPPTSTSTDPASSSLSSLPAPETNLSSSNPTQPLANGPAVSQPQPSGPGSSSSPAQGLQQSPSWAPTSVSDVDGATNGSATAAESTSSPTTSQAPNPPPEVKPSVQAENASKTTTSTEQAAPSINGTSREASHGVSPNAASTAVNSDAGDHKPPSPALPKTAASAGPQSSGDPKAGLVLSLNEELIKICVAFSSIAPTAAEANEYQTRLSSNLGWLASVADTATQARSAVALPILQAPKPLPPSPLTSQCADSLQKLPGLYARMQELFRPDYERKMRREAKMKARVAAGAGFNAAGVVGAGIGGPSASVLPPPGAAVPVAGVKREHEADVETGDRKRAAVGGGAPMSAGGSPTRPSTVRAASLALSSTQSPVLTGQSPVTAATPGTAGGMQMASNMSTPRIPATGFVPPISMPHRHSPQNSISTSASAFGQNSQVSPVGMAHQPQRQPSLPPTAQHSPTHPQLPINNQFGQLQQHQQAQAGLMAQTTGDAGLTLAPQRPPSVSQPTGTFPQPQPGFQAPGMNNRPQQQPPQQAMPGMGMGGPARPPMTDDQRNQQLQMQIRQQMAAQQGLTPMQLQQQQQAQAFGQLQTQQPQGGIQPNALNAANQAAGGAVPPTNPGAGAMGGNQPMNQVQVTIQHLHNPNNPITQHLHRSVPNFAGLPLPMQVNHFHAVQMRLMQNQQQQQQAAMAANAANGNVNGTQGMQQRPPSAAGPGAIPPGISGLRNMRQGTASPRIPSTVPPQGMTTPQRQISGQHSGMNPPSSTVPPLGMGAQGMTPQQRQMMMMQQQQSQLSRMQPPGAGGQSPSPSHPQFGQGLPNMSPMNRQAAAQFGNQVGGQQVQVAGGGAGPWSAASAAGYVSSPLNPGWSPQATAGPGSMSAPSPAGSGFHVGASPAHHSEAGATPRHSGATPQGGMGAGAGFGDSAGSSGTDFANGGIDPSTLFNEWTN